MALGIIGIVIALVIFLYGAYKNVSVLYLAPLCGVIVAITNGLNPTNAFTSLYVGLRNDHIYFPNRILRRFIW